MKKNEKLISNFQVEELEQRFEMGSWYGGGSSGSGGTPVYDECEGVESWEDPDC